LYIKNLVIINNTAKPTPIGISDLQGIIEVFK